MRRLFEFQPSAAIRSMTAKLIAAQRVVPTSPGEIIDGRPLLCLAACAAEAGLIDRGRYEQAVAFRERAARSTDKAVVVEAFEQLGWPSSACDAAMRFNDSQSPALRKARILEALGHH